MVADHADRAVSLVRTERFDVILSDVVMPAKDGLTMLAELRELNVTSPVIMISGQADIGMAVRATKLGAADFLEKPISTDKLMVSVENALRLVRLEEENRQLRQRVGRHEIVWRSQAMRRVMAQVDRLGRVSRASASSARPAPARSWLRVRSTARARARSRPS